MAGHSKWANIKHKKAANDKKRGKLWSKLIREVTVAAKEGGGDIDANPRLRLAVDKARGANMPNDTVDRAIKRGAGGEGVGADRGSRPGAPGRLPRPAPDRLPRGAEPAAGERGAPLGRLATGQPAAGAGLFADAGVPPAEEGLKRATRSPRAASARPRSATQVAA